MTPAENSTESTNRMMQVDPSIYNLHQQFYRANDITPRRPLAPREVRYGNGFVRWAAPPKGIPFTHYGIRIDHDGGIPDIVVPFGCRFTAVPPGKKAWVSSYNAQSELESPRVEVPISAGSGSGSGLTTISITVAAGTASTEIVVDGAIPFLALQIINNATGEGRITWGENFEEGLDTDISDYEGSINRFLFVWREDKYRLWCAPLLGR